MDTYRVTREAEAEMTGAVFRGGGRNDLRIPGYGVPRLVDITPVGDGTYPSAQMRLWRNARTDG